MYSTLTSLTPGSLNGVLATPSKRDGGTRKIGVLLSNLGTPDGTDYWSVRRYLAEFLSDPRIVELPRALWLPMLHTIVLSLRPAAKRKVYRTIWNEDLNESPLKTTTRRQAIKLQDSLDKQSIAGHSKLIVAWGMRYGNPSIESAVEQLSQQGCEQIVLVPLYPQYSFTTTASTCDKLYDVMKKTPKQLNVRVAQPYYDDHTYIDALARSVESRLDELDLDPEVIVASFHGIPQRNVANGDPYYLHCQRTG
jgi:ferrochelatase